MRALYGYTSDITRWPYPKCDPLHDPIVEGVIRRILEYLALPHGLALAATLLSAVVVDLLLHILPVGVVELLA